MIDRRRSITTTTLADLGERVALHARCARCGRVRRLDLAALRVRYGALPLERLRKRLRCGRCGARDPELTQLWDVGGPYIEAARSGVALALLRHVRSFGWRPRHG